MNTKLLLKVAGMGTVILALIVGLSLYTNLTEPAETASQDAQTNTIVLAIEGLYAEKQISISSEKTVLNILQELNATDPAVQLATKEYVGLGTMIEGMGAYKNGADGNYWQYFVNGVLAPVGADMYVPKQGDHIEWRFAAPEM